jgi:hypothetical protein
MRSASLLLSLSLLLPLGSAWSATDEQEAIILDDEDEAGFGIPLWGNKKRLEKADQHDPQTLAEEKTPAPQPEANDPEPAADSQSNCIILDDEDEDEDGVCGVPIRFLGGREQAQPGDGEPTSTYAPELYRVVLDEEDETNESGFGIPLPTEDNPQPWKGARSTPLPEDERFDDD